MGGPWLADLWRCRRGGGAVEYMLVLAVLATAVALAIYLVVPGLRHGVVRLLERILA